MLVKEKIESREELKVLKPHFTILLKLCCLILLEGFFSIVITLAYIHILPNTIS